MVHDIKNALLQNDEVQRWKLLVEKVHTHMHTPYNS